MTTMRAVLMTSIAEPPEVVKVERPIAPPRGVVIEVRATGLCRSDWHAWAGHDDITLPHVPGHEFSGVVAEVGAGVERWQVGDSVTMPFIEGCGRCEWCLSGNAQVCPQQEQPGFTHWGSFAEYVAVHEADVNLVAVPEGVSFEAAASLGCRFATAYRALDARAQVQPGEWVVVFGAGGVGLSAVAIAASRGARVVAVDRNPDALRLARAEGAHEVILSGPDSDTDAAAAVHERTDGGAHVSLDAVGSEQTCHDAVMSLRRRGRHVQIGLLPPIEGHPRVPMARVIGWELDVFGSHGMAAVDYPPMLDDVRRGALSPQRLIARTVGLAEAARMLPTFDRSTLSGMTIIDPTR